MNTLRCRPCCWCWYCLFLFPYCSSFWMRGFKRPRNQHVRFASTYDQSAFLGCWAYYWTAVVSGVNLLLLSSTCDHLMQLHALSYTGRCKTFDTTADGYGRGEACIAFVNSHVSLETHALAVIHGRLLIIIPNRHTALGNGRYRAWSPSCRLFTKSRWS